MDKFFNPRSIVIFGVSEAPKNLARNIVENLAHFGFTGEVYAIGASGGSVAGKPVRKSIDDIPGTPDLAVLLIPARHVPATLEACGAKGIRHVIIESGGFTEFAAGQRVLEDEVLSLAKRYGIMIIGPNCFGTVNTKNGVVLPFFILKKEYMKSGAISLISQSGGIFYDTCMLCSIENVRLNKLVSMGNKLIATETELLQYMVDDTTTETIGLYLESFSDGRRLMEIAVSTKKPIVLLKGNRSAQAQEIARFHTTALTGDDAVTDAALRQAGIHRVTNFQEMIDCFKIFSLPVIRGPRLALISRSGGHGVLSADAAYRHGFRLARFSDTFLKAIKEKKLNVIQATNPLDIGDVYDLNEYSFILERALTESDVDGVAFIVTYSSESDGEKIRNFLKNVPVLMKQYDKPVVVCIATNRDEWLVVKDASDTPVFVDVDPALAALKRSHEQYRFVLKKAGEDRRTSTDQDNNASVFSVGLMAQGEVFTVLRQYGLPVVDFAIARNRDEVLREARRIGYPVALKNGTKGVLHKTEAGGVILDIQNPGELEDACDRIRCDMYVVQKMVMPGREMIVGVRHDREFGHCIVVGLGGVFTEILNDTAMRILPVHEEEAREMLEELKGAAILRGFRGAPPGDIEALQSVLAGVSRLVLDHPEILTIDINPLIIGEKGRGCIIVDAKIETR